MKFLISFTFILLAIKLNAQPYQSHISVHDPVMIKAGKTYFLFSTGNGIRVWSSKDLQLWKSEKPVFAVAPEWAVRDIPGFKGYIWAPDIYFDQQKYYLYYAVSVFGKNISAIGVATNKTLDPESLDFKWIDHGKVIQSFPRKTNWNAIDPNVIRDENHVAWMAFGSFWDGIKLARLSDDLLHIDDDVSKLPTIASRRENNGMDSLQKSKIENAIEAPFIFKKAGYYYLFASTDYCCQGPKSTYKIIVGRSKRVTGPYLDGEGKPMASGGGSIVLEGNKDWYGVGHNAVCHFDGKDFLIFHGYDAKDNAKPKLRVEELTWHHNWPILKKQP